MYKSLTKAKQYSELEAHETLKRVASANAILKHYESSSLIIVKRHAMVRSFFKANLVYLMVSTYGKSALGPMAPIYTRHFLLRQRKLMWETYRVN